MTIDFTGVFRKRMNTAQFVHALDVVQNNSEGRVWLIGGAVYRTLADALYIQPHDIAHFDFLVEEIPQQVIVPRGWTLTKTRYGNPRLINQTVQVDISEIGTFHSIARREVRPNIDSYLTGVPLTVQSIVYDFQYDRIIGKVGTRALEEQTVAVNNKKEAEFVAKCHDSSLEALVKRKAVSLNFTPII